MRNAIIGTARRQAMPIITQPGITLLGSTVRDAVTNGDVHFQASVLLAKQFSSLAATMMMDLSVEAEAFGSPIRLSDDEVPTVFRRIVDSMETVESLRIPTLADGRLHSYVNVAGRIARSITDRPTLAGCIGPISLAGRLFDVAELMSAMYMEPETIHALLEKCTALLSTYVQAFKSAGANGVLIAEPVAGTLSPDLCEEFSSAYVRRIVHAVQDDSFAVILHNCGDTMPLLVSMQGTGTWGIHLGNKCDLPAALDSIDSQKIVFGNLDPVGVFRQGTPESVRTATMHLLEATAAHKNYVISSGCDIPFGTPIANVAAFFDAVEHCAYPG